MFKLKSVSNTTFSHSPPFAPCIVDKVILGSAAIKDKNFLKKACKRFPKKIALGLDAKDGKLSVSGWKESSGVSTLDFLNEVNDYSISRLIFTDINKDGAMQGPNIEATAALARQVSTPIIASGGVSNYGDLKALKAKESAGIEGVICGRALYDGRINICEARELLAG